MQRYFIFLMIFMASCAAKKQAAEFEAQPLWVKQKPVEAGYYIGVGSAKKVGTAREYKDKARRDAMADLAESISLQVSSTSVLHTIETKQGLTETFDQQIKVSTDDYLEGFEPVDNYENDLSYWVYYRIKESTYRERKELKKKQAVDAAHAKLLSGIQAENSASPKEAITFYLQGLDAIYNYLGEETNILYMGNNIDVGNKLYSSLNQVLSSLRILAETSDMNFKRGETSNQTLVFKTYYGDEPIQGIPVKFAYTGGYLNKDRDISNEDGKVELRPGKIVSKNNQEEFTATIDYVDIAAKAVDNLFIRGLINGYESELARVIIFIEPRSLAISVPEAKCSPDQCNQLIKSFNQLAIDSGYEIQVGNEADFLFILDYQYRKGESAGGLFSVYLNGDIVVKDKNKTEVWSKKIREIKGVAEEMEAARGRAFAEMVNSLSRIYFKEGITSIN